MGKYKHYKGNIGGGVDISGKSKMSGKAKSLMSFPGGMPGPGEYGNIVGKGMMKYMAGEPVGMAKYKSDAQRKAAHASMAEQGAGKHGKHMGPEKELIGNQNRLPEELKAKIEAAPGKYGKHKGPKKEKVKSLTKPKKANLSSEAEGEMINSNFVSNDPKGTTLKSTSKPKSRKPSKEIAKSKIKEGKKLKKEGRQEKRDARKDARKAKRSARLDKKIALQEFKGKQKLKSGDKLGAKAKQDRISNLKARKAKK